VPRADPAARAVDRREHGGEAEAALQRRLQLGERDIGRRRDKPLEGGLMRLEARAPMPAGARAGAGLPVARTRGISLIAAQGLSAKRRAAPRIELPCATARTIRRRRSIQIAAGLTTSRLPPPISSNHERIFHARENA
jgi:hypothetical protein